MDFATQLRINKQPVRVESNKPFLLNKPGWGWFIYEGRIDVFSVRIEQGLPKGARNHYFTANEGEILLSVPVVEDADFHFLAVPTPNTFVIEFRLETLSEFANEENHNDGKDAIIPLIDKWITQLAKGVSFGNTDVSDRSTLPGFNQVFRANSIVHSRKQVLWLEILDGDALLLGMNETRKEGTNTLVPFTGELYLQPLGKIRANCYTTAEAFEKPLFQESLDHFYYLLLICLEFKNKLGRVDELNLLREKTAFAELSQSDALYKIASVVNTKIRKAHLESREDPMLTACRLVAKFTGIEVKKPVKPRTEEIQSFTLNDVLHASRFRARKVKLTEGWWLNDTGSLLAFTIKGNNPVALVQQGPGNIEYVDVVDGIRKPMKAELSGLIGSFAYQFYPPLPNSAISGKELIGFGLKNCRHEILMIILFSLVGGVLNMLIPLVTGYIFDKVIPQSEYRQLAVFGAMLIFISI